MHKHVVHCFAELDQIRSCTNKIPMVVLKPSKIVRFYSGCATGSQVVFEKRIEQQWRHDQTNRETRLTRRHSRIRQVCECS